jgi:hypothetical protein
VGHRVGWKEVKILEIESNSTYKKYKIGPYGMLNQSDQPIQFENFSNMDPPYQP